MLDKDLRTALIVAVVGALIAFLATAFQTMMPIIFSSDSDFSICVYPSKVEPEVFIPRWRRFPS